MKENPAVERDVLVVGGGPAALSAALWCADLGLTALVLDRSAELGGQLLNIYNPITNYVGLVCANGREMRDRFLGSLKNCEVELQHSAEVSELDAHARTISLSDGSRFRGNALIVATGVRRRKLGVGGEDAFEGKGLLDSGVRNRKLVEGKRVAVIGGGDAAVENAILLAGLADRIYLIHRGSSLSARDEFVKRAKDNPRIDIRLNTVVESFDGAQSLDQISTRNPQTNKVDAINVDFGLIRIGYQPNSELLSGKVELDQANYVIVNSRGETSMPAIYAVGDVADPRAPTISGAAGSGATAAKEIFAFCNDAERL